MIESHGESEWPGGHCKLYLGNQWQLSNYLTWLIT